MAKSLQNLLVAGSIGILTFPQATSFSVVASLTTLLSFGERPYLVPENATKAPVLLIVVFLVLKSAGALPLNPQ
jgi:hypothetical protein